MASTYAQIAVDDSADTIIAANTDRKKLILKNTGSDDVYIGDTNSVVDTDDNANGGYKIVSGDTFYLNDYTGIVWGICAGGESTTISVIEEELA